MKMNDENVFTVDARKLLLTICVLNITACVVGGGLSSYIYQGEAQERISKRFSQGINFATTRVCLCVCVHNIYLYEVY